VSLSGLLLTPSEKQEMYISYHRKGNFDIVSKRLCQKLDGDERIQRSA